MLTKITETAVPKQVVLDFKGTSDTVIYTVPVGKTCTGTFFGDPNQNGFVKVNDIALTVSRTSVAAASVVPVKLIAGTVLKAQGTNGNSYFIGVEE